MVFGVFTLHCLRVLFRPVFEDSGPGRPLSCFMEEPLPYTDPAGGRDKESPFTPFPKALSSVVDLELHVEEPRGVLRMALC